MITTTRSLRRFLLAGLFVGASGASLLAQNPADQPSNGDRRHGPPSVLFDTLDTNHDGVLSAEEIANAPTALKGLLKEGQTQLTRDDLRPERKDGQTPLAGHRSPADDQAADDRGPREHRRWEMDGQEDPSPWRHHFRHDADGQRGERPAWARHEQEMADDHYRPDFEREDRPDERHRFEHPRRFELQADEREEADAAREMDQILGALHHLEREVHQLKEAQQKPAPAPAAPAPVAPAPTPAAP